MQITDQTTALPLLEQPVTKLQLGKFSITQADKLLHRTLQHMGIHTINDLVHVNYGDIVHALGKSKSKQYHFYQLVMQLRDQLVKPEDQLEYPLLNINDFILFHLNTTATHVPITALNLPSPLAETMIHYDIQYINQLVALPFNWFMHAPGIGPKNITHLYTHLFQWSNQTNVNLDMTVLFRDRPILFAKSIEDLELSDSQKEYARAQSWVTVLDIYFISSQARNIYHEDYYIKKVLGRYSIIKTCEGAIKQWNNSKLKDYKQNMPYN